MGPKTSRFDLPAGALSTKMNFWDRVVLVASGHPSAWATEIGMNPTTVTHWKGAPRDPYKTTMDRLVEKTGIPAAWWLRGEGEIPPDAARRFGLLPSGDLQTGPNEEGRMPHGQYQPMIGTLPANPLPELHRTAATQRHAAFHPMFGLFMRLWTTERLSWLPDGATLEQAALLVNGAAEMFTQLKGRAPAFGDFNPDELADAQNCLATAYMKHLPPVATNDTDAASVQVRARK